ncbi:F-box only protein 21-like [Pseudomyrmex gracilis]|uniref:F-box only protein 21-like n=1 Tax=Pseudomyrmex gracilis TaxID=219809 RepID=UPI000995AA40|nr:F-box only protein 21-like [Pseudomyrmex gracilis]
MSAFSQPDDVNHVIIRGTPLYSNSNMTAITSLSDDVLSMILELEIISIEDIMSFRCACNRFSKAVSPNNLLWRKKFFQRWPNLKSKYNHENINYEQHVIRSIQCRKNLHQYLSLMPEKFYHVKYLIDEDMNDFNLSFWLDTEVSESNYDFLMDELDNIFVPSCNNLTQVHYAQSLMTYIKHSYLRRKWQKFINKPQKQQILEDAVSIVEDWVKGRQRREDRNCTINVPEMLDTIADKVLDNLRKEYPNHSIFSAPSELFTYCKYNNIVDNYWDKNEGRQVLDAIRKVLYDELGFKGVRNPEISFDGTSSIDNDIFFVDYVLQYRCGHFISLAVIFIGVARRLGLRCEVSDIPSHFFLKWKPKYNENENEINLYIDLLNRGNLRDFTDCPMMRNVTSMDKCPMKFFARDNTIFGKIIKQTIINVLRITQLRQVEETYDLLQLQLLVEPTNSDKLVQLHRHCSTYYLNFKGFFDTLERFKEIFHTIGDKVVGTPLYIEGLFNHMGIHKLTHVLENNTTTISKPLRNPEERPKDMKYAVGMLVSWVNTPNFTSNTGVIIGWYLNSQSWEQYKGPYKIDIIFNHETSNRCSFRPNSWPYYKVLCNNHRKEIYVAEGCIKPSDQWIYHKIHNDEIGRYFCSFKGSHYVPNEILAKEYPYDRDYLVQRYEKLRRHHTHFLAHSLPR